MAENLLGIDVGTASTKGVLARPDGTVVARAERPHAVSLPRPGWVAHDAEAVWWADVLALCRELLPQADGRVAGVCASGIGPCLLPADADGRPLRPAILYGIDTRATEEIAELTERYGEDEILARCGSPLTSQAVWPKLLWVRRREPDVWAATERIFMASSLVVHRLTGEYVLDHGSASQCDPLYDLEGNRWLEEWAQEIAPGLELPRLAWPAEAVGEVTAAAAQETGLPQGIPVMAGTIDAWAEAASVGVREPGDLMLMYGSTLFLIQVVERSDPSRRVWTTAGLLPGTRDVAAGMATSGLLTDWLRHLVGDPPFATLVEEAAGVRPGADGLLVLPYFAGERTPLFDPAARGVVCGLTLSHGRAHLYRAVLEGIAYGVRHNLEAMEAAGGPIRRLVAVGGGTKGGLWTQVVSDVTGRAQALPHQTVGASYGDALLAAIGAGLAPADADWSEIADTVQPREDAGAVYEELYPRYRELYGATRDTAHALAHLQAGGAPETEDAAVV